MIAVRLWIHLLLFDYLEKLKCFRQSVRFLARAAAAVATAAVAATLRAEIATAMVETLALV